MLTTQTTSITELREQLGSLVDSLEESGPVMMVRHDKPAARSAITASYGTYYKRSKMDATPPFYHREQQLICGPI